MMRETELLNYSEDLVKSSKLIVFWSCLVTLLNFCFQCPRKAHISKLRTQGLAVLVNITCENRHENQWCSQPKLFKARAGNIWLASVVLFSGSFFSRMSEMMKIVNISFFFHICCIFDVIKPCYFLQLIIYVSNIRKRLFIIVTTLPWI